MFFLIAFLSCLGLNCQDDNYVIPILVGEPEVVHVLARPTTRAFIPKRHFANCFSCGFDRVSTEPTRIVIDTGCGEGNTTILFDESRGILERPSISLSSIAFENKFRRKQIMSAFSVPFSKSTRTALRVKVQGNYIGGFQRIEVIPSFIEGRTKAIASFPEVWILDGNTLTMTEPASDWRISR